MNKQISAYALICSALFLIGLTLRLLFLGSMEFWWDEFVTIGRALPSVSELLRGLYFQSPSPVSTDCSPPLHHLFVHVMLLISRSESVIRLPSVVCGMASIFFSCKLSERIFNRRIALLAVSFCVFSVFHIYYSRDIRWYSTFFACSLGALYFLNKSLVTGKRIHLLCFVVFTTLSLYASYTSLTYVLGEGLFLVGYTIVLLIYGDITKAKSTAIIYTALFFWAFILYLPWLPAQFLAFLSFKGKGTFVPFEIDRLMMCFRFFLEYFYQGKFNYLWFAVPLCFLGVMHGLVSKSLRFGSMLFFCWSLTPLLVLYNVKTEFQVHPKYVMSLFYFMAITLALGIDALATFIERQFKVNAKFVNVCSGCVLLAVIASNFNYVSFYQGKMPSYKATFRELALNSYPGDYLFYDTEKQLSFLGWWHLGTHFPSAKDHLERSYKHFLITSGDTRVWSNAKLLVDKEGLSISRMGIVNVSPIVAEPNNSNVFDYKDRFDSLKVFNDAWSTENATVDLLSGGGLVPADMSRPGCVTYAFDIPGERQPDGLSLDIEAVVTQRTGLTFDGYVEILAGNTLETLVQVGRIDSAEGPEVAKSFGYSGTYAVSKHYILPDRLSPADKLYVVVKYSVGTVDGYMKIASLEFQAKLQDGRLVNQEYTSRTARTILNNLQVQPNSSSLGTRIPRPPVAFSVNSDLLPLDGSGRYGDSADRARYLKENPSAVLVYTAFNAQKQPFLEIYDSWLEPSLSLLSSENSALKLSEPLGGLKAEGGYVPANLRWNETIIPLTLGTPPSSFTLFNPGKTGVIVFRPRFDKAGFNPEDFDTFRDVRLLPPAPCLSCMNEQPCFAVYRFNSLFPVTRIVMTTYPRLVNDKEKKNWLGVSVSLDGQQYEQVFKIKSNGDSSGVGGSYPQIDEITLDHPAKSVLIRLDMANESSQWWSSSANSMTFELFFNTSLQLDTASDVNVVPYSDSGRAINFSLSPHPFSAWENLRPGLKVNDWWRPLFR